MIDALFLLWFITLRTASNSSVHFLLWCHQIFEVCFCKGTDDISCCKCVCVFTSAPAYQLHLTTFWRPILQIARSVSQFYPELCFADKIHADSHLMRKKKNILKLYQFLGEEKLEKTSEMEAVQRKKLDEKEKRRTREKKMIKGSKRTFSRALIHPTDFLLWC